MASSRKRKVSSQVAQPNTRIKRRTRQSVKQPSKTFFDLPGEIRNVIYKLALTESTPITVKKQYGGPPLTFASKAVRAECLSLYLANNTFNVDNINLKTWAEAVGERNLFAYATRLQFEVSTYAMYPRKLNVYLTLIREGAKHNIEIRYQIPEADLEEYEYLVLQLRDVAMRSTTPWNTTCSQHAAASSFEKLSDLTFADLLKLRSKLSTVGRVYSSHSVQGTSNITKALKSWEPIIIKPTGGLRPRQDLKDICTAIQVNEDGTRPPGSICANFLFRHHPRDDKKDKPWGSLRGKLKAGSKRKK